MVSGCSWCSFDLTAREITGVTLQLVKQNMVFCIAFLSDRVDNLNHRSEKVNAVKNAEPQALFINIAVNWPICIISKIH